MADLRFLSLATDPNLVPGIYNGCDQWCHYCPATARCLAFQCRSDSGDGSIYENIEERIFREIGVLVMVLAPLESLTSSGRLTLVGIAATLVFSIPACIAGLWLGSEHD